MTSSISPGIAAKWLIPSPTWIIRESFSGIPSSWAIIAASSSARASRLAAIAPISRARSSRGVCDQPSNASRAASTARSTSTGVQPGTVAIASSVVGLTTSIGSAPLGSTHSPPIKTVSRACSSAAVAIPNLRPLHDSSPAKVARVASWARRRPARLQS